MRILLMLSSLAVIETSLLSAQVVPELELSGSYNPISGPTFFSDYWNGGTGIVAGVSIPLSSYFHVAGDFAYSRFPLQSSKVRNELQQEANLQTARGNVIRVFLGLPTVGQSTVQIDGGALSVITAMFGARVTYPLGRVSPYLGGTFGLYREHLSDLSVNGTSQDGSSENAAALRVGAGIKVRVSNHVGVISGADWALAFTEGESVSYIPLRLGMFIVP